MKWTKEAEETIKKVPFFVRKKVRSRIEKEVMASGNSVVSLAEVKAAQARYLSDMESEIKGYRIETCFGSGGCPNRAQETEHLVKKIERIFETENLLEFLKANVKDPLKFHHEFKVTIADCPNACSRPQIADIGIIGAILPEITPVPCTQCNACVDQCKEDAVKIIKETGNPIIDLKSCVMCGQCVAACPSGTIAVEKKGFRIQIGGKLGRHPQLATELPGIFSEDEIIDAVKRCIANYKKYSQNGQRFGSILNRFEIDEIIANT